MTMFGVKATKGAIAEVIQEFYPDTVSIGYKESVDTLQPVAESWWRRVWLAVRGRATHHMRPTLGNCRFTVLHSKELDEEARTRTFAAVEDVRPMGIRVHIEWVEVVTPQWTQRVQASLR